MSDSRGVDDALHRLCVACGGFGKVEGLVSNWLGVTSERLDGIRAGLERGDAALVGRLAHTIKGSSATFGAVELGELAREVEAEIEEKGLSERGINLAEKLLSLGGETLSQVRGAAEALQSR